MKTLDPFRMLRPALLVALCAFPAGLAAQAQYERPPETRGPHTRHPEAVEAINQLKSPYCPGFMLEVCSSSQGAALRDSIEMMAEAGMTAEAIVEDVLARHGEEWRALPKAEGRSLIAWIVPPLGALLGVLAAVLALRRMRGPRRPTVPDDVSDEERDRLERALRDLEAEEETAF